jgi:hypothetical protein
VAKEVCEFFNSYGIKLLNSSPYYPQAKSSNKTLIKLIEKMIEDNLKR